jgi:hypothetical protein
MSKPATRLNLNATNEIKHDDFNKKFENWFNELYTIQIEDEELLKFYETVRYKGFDRTEVLKDLYRKVEDPKVVTEIIIVCALKGPIRAAITKLSNGRTISSFGIPASGLKGGLGVSCARITASTADLAAFYLKKLKIPKRINSSKLPGWLQFPSAASIKLPEKFIEDHRQFSIEFSKKIAPKNLQDKEANFNDDIYNNMRDNAYLDPRLKLFEE